MILLQRPEGLLEKPSHHVEECGEHLRSTLILWTVETTIEKMKLWGIEWCNGKSTNKVLTKNKTPKPNLLYVFSLTAGHTFSVGQPAWMPKVLQGRRHPECTGETKTLVLQPETYITSPGSFCDTDSNRDSVLLGPLFHDANNVFYLRITSALQKVQYFPQSLSINVKSKDLSEG